MGVIILYYEECCSKSWALLEGQKWRMLLCQLQWKRKNMEGMSLIFGLNATGSK